MIMLPFTNADSQTSRIRRMAVREFNIDIQNISLFVRENRAYAQRPTIVFLHDSLGCVELWRDFPERLCKETSCNMLVYDRQGYGKSAPMQSHHRTNDYLQNEADTLHILLEKLSLKNVILFGHSDGGSIALIAAGKYPRIVQNVIVEAAHIFVEEVTLTGIRATAHAFSTTNLKARLEKYHGDKTETLFKAWTETWLSDAFRSWTIEDLIPSIQCPVLFIQGECDEYGTIKQLEGVMNGSGSEVETALLPGVHHSPHKEVPAKVLEISAHFLHGRITSALSS